MTSISRVLRVFAVTLVIGTGLVARAEAIPVVSVEPSSQTANVGDMVSVDILISGLSVPVGGFSFLLDFVDTILSGVSFTLDPDNTFTGLADFSPGFTGGTGTPLDVLAAGTGNGAASFRLANVQFLAIANGVSPLKLSNVDISDINGNSLVPVGAVSGRVCVGGPCPVPEPGLLSLLGAGAAALAMRYRRSRT